MKLISCKIENFGKLRDTEFRFQDGLNVILRENGFGKSTLAAFLRIMFYGLSGERKSQDNENERRKYRPWQGGTFGGSLVFQLENGRSYRITRSFGERKSQDRFQLYDAETNLPSEDFSEAIGEELFRIDELSFRRTSFIGQQALETGVTSEINARIGNVSEEPEDMKRYTEVMGKLKDELNALSPHRRTGAIFKKRMELEILQTDCAARASLEQQALTDDAAEHQLRETQRRLQDQLEHTSRNLQVRSEQQDALSESKDYAHLCEAAAEAEKRYREQEQRFFGADFAAMQAPERLQRLQQEQRRLQGIFRDGMPTEMELREAETRLARLDALRADAAGERRSRKKTKTAPKPYRILGPLLLAAALLSYAARLPWVCSAGLLGIGALLVLLFFMTATRGRAAEGTGEPENARNAASERAWLDHFLRRFYPDRRAAVQDRGDAPLSAGGAEAAPQPSRFTLLRKLEQDVLACRRLEDLRTAAAELSTRQQAVERFEKSHNMERLRAQVSSGEEENLASLTKRMETLRMQLSELDTKLQALSEQRRQNDERLAVVYEKERRYAAGRSELAALETRNQLLTLVREHLEKARNDFSKQYMDPLMTSFTRYYRMLCHEEELCGEPQPVHAAEECSAESQSENHVLPEIPFQMDADFELQLLENGQTHSPELLSAGFRNLVALGRRMAFVDAMYEHERPFLILDDPFVNLDDEHLEGSRRFLKDIAARYQVLYLTCTEGRSLRATI